MRRSIRILAAATVAAAVLVPAGAQADHCTGTDRDWGQIYVFSYHRYEVNEDVVVRAPTVTSEAVGCTLLTEADGVDSRWIYPGSTYVSARYLEEADLGLELHGTINGLGADNVEVTFVREPGIGDLGFNYDSEIVQIDPSQTGTLTVTVDVPVGQDPETGELFFETFTETYRTVDQPSDQPGHLP